MKLYEKFPCGYVFRLEFNFFEALVGGFECDFENGCPLYGHSCKEDV